MHPPQPQHRYDPDVAPDGVRGVLCVPSPLSLYERARAHETDSCPSTSRTVLPVTPEYVAYVLEKERPDGILLTFGGQSALNVGIQLEKMGVFERLGVKVLGTQVRTLEVSEDRDLFVKALDEIGIPAATSTAVSTVKDALEAAEKIGYPVILRSAFSLGGLGSGFAENEEELRDLSAKSLSLSPQVLIEKSLKGWKELEYEVVRDAADNVIICCNMEVRPLPSPSS